MSEVTIFLEILLLAYYLSYEYLLYCFTLLKLTSGLLSIEYLRLIYLPATAGVVFLQSVRTFLSKEIICLVYCNLQAYYLVGK